VVIFLLVCAYINTHFRKKACLAKQFINPVANPRTKGVQGAIATTSSMLAKRRPFVAYYNIHNTLCPKKCNSGIAELYIEIYNSKNYAMIKSDLDRSKH